MGDEKTVSFHMDARGVCTVCGGPAYHHMATKCEEHRAAKTPRPTSAPTNGPEFRVIRPDVTPTAPKKVDAKDAEKAARAVELERSILVDLNPVLLQGFAMLCRPIPPDNFYQTKDGQLLVTDIGSQVLLSEGEAKILGKAAAELERSPIGTMATAAIGPVLPVAFGIAALGVVAFHGYKVMAIRQQLLLQYNEQVQRQNAEHAGTPMPPPTPTVGDDIASGFREADSRGFGTTVPPNGTSPDLDFTAA